MKRGIFLLGILGLLILPTLGRAMVIEGVDVPPQKVVSGKTLRLNGAGVRVFVFGFVPIKVFVASFYTPTVLRTERMVSASQGPMQFNFTFLRSVGQGQVTEAWNAQFKASVSYTYPSLAADQAAFVKMFGPLKKFGVETVEIEGNQTRVYDGGKLKGTIQGKDFQKAFLSLWFGLKPVVPELKNQLLGI